MARHHNYSKRSRESRKAMGDGLDGQHEEPDDQPAEDWQAPVDGTALPPDPVS